MAKVLIESTTQAIEIIAKEVRKMFDNETDDNEIGEIKSEDIPKVRPNEAPKYCVECNAETWYVNSAFCKICATSFYNGEESE